VAQSGDARSKPIPLTRIEQPDTFDGHDLDEYYEHDLDECQRCLEANHTVKNDCRCGICCCSLLIEATARDAAREPLIKILGKKMRDDWTSEYPPDDEADWSLNGKGGACVFLKEEAGVASCSIHDTRPMCCRLFCCDKYKSGFADENAQG
jgi:hypothetical protein